MGGFEDGGAEAADDGMVFEGEDWDVVAQKIADELGVDGFGKAGVIVGDVVFGAKGIDCGVGVDGWGAETEDGDIGAVGVEVFMLGGEEAGFAEFEGWGVGEDFGNGVSWVADGTERGVPGTHELEALDQAVFVDDGHEDGVWEGAEEGDVAEAVVDRSVATDEASTVEAEANAEPLEGDFLERLIEGALEEGRVNGEEWAEPGFGHAREHVEGVGFADAGVEGTVWEFFEGLGDASAVGHGGGGGDCSLVTIHDIGDGIGEGGGEGAAGGGHADFAAEGFVAFDSEGLWGVESCGV